MQRLNNSIAVRRKLARVIADLEAGRLGVGQARTMGYLLSLLLQAIRVDDLERRLEAVEAAAASTMRRAA